MKCSDEDNLTDFDFDMANLPDVNVKRVVRFEDYEDTSGVWACWGQDKEDSKWICLNVGSGKTIGKEMRIDKMYSEGTFRHRDGVFTNFLNEEVFKFDRPKDIPITTREWVWHDIGEKYRNLLFFLVLESSDEKERLKIEMKYAHSKKARYWNESPGQKKKITNPDGDK